MACAVGAPNQRPEGLRQRESVCESSERRKFSHLSVKRKMGHWPAWAITFIFMVFGGLTQPAAARVSGYELSMPPSVKAGDFTGFRPCSFKGLDARDTDYADGEHSLFLRTEPKRSNEQPYAENDSIGCYTDTRTRLGVGQGQELRRSRETQRKVRSQRKRLFIGLYGS